MCGIGMELAFVCRELGRIISVWGAKGTFVCVYEWCDLD